MAPVVEGLPTNQETLSSNFSTTKNMSFNLKNKI
jgi:hypothetical protein